MQLGAWGIGLRADVDQYRVQARDPATSITTRELSVSLLRGNIVAGYSFGRGELVLRYGLAISSVELELPAADASEPELEANVGGFRHATRRVPVAWSVFGLFDDDTRFRVGGALDSAERYFAWTASLGIWR